MAAYGFGPFTLDTVERRVFRGNERVNITGKTFDVLSILVEAQGRLVYRDALISRLWSDVTVEERNLTVRISTLRKALAGAVDCIETVSRVGYRIAVPVQSQTAQTVAPTSGAALPPELAQIRQDARKLLAQAERLPVLQALGLFERIITHEPGDAGSHAGLASAYLMLASTTVRRPLPIDEAIQLARESSKRALALDHANGEARAVLGYLCMIYDGDWEAAAREIERAATDAPDSVEAAVALGALKAATGSHAAAIAALTKARQLDPARRTTLEQLALAQWMSGASASALETLAEASAIDPSARRPYFRRMVILDHAGQHNLAMVERLTWLRMLGETATATKLERVAGTKGHIAAMTEWISVLERLHQWYEVAIQRMVLGDRSGTLGALERCIEERSDRVITVGQYPSFRPLQGEVRFHSILAKVGLELASAIRLRVVK